MIATTAPSGMPSSVRTRSLVPSLGGRSACTIPCTRTSVPARRRGHMDLRTSSETAHRRPSRPAVTALRMRVGQEKLPHTLCSVDTVDGRRPEGMVRAATLVTPATNGECACTTSNPVMNRRSRHGHTSWPNRPPPSSVAATPDAASWATSWSLSGRTYAAWYWKRTWSATRAEDTSSCSAPPGPRPLMSHATRTGTVGSALGHRHVTIVPQCGPYTRRPAPGAGRPGTQREAHVRCGRADGPGSQGAGRAARPHVLRRRPPGTRRPRALAGPGGRPGSRSPPPGGRRPVRRRTPADGLGRRPVGARPQR